VHVVARDRPHCRQIRQLQEALGESETRNTRIRDKLLGLEQSQAANRRAAEDLRRELEVGAVTLQLEWWWWCDVAAVVMRAYPPIHGRALAVAAASTHETEDSKLRELLLVPPSLQSGSKREILSLILLAGSWSSSICYTYSFRIGLRALL
jgi:hypothetical protein